jgi:hypothetical protein
MGHQSKLAAQYGVGNAGRARVNEVAKDVDGHLFRP